MKEKGPIAAAGEGKTAMLARRARGTRLVKGDGEAEDGRSDSHQARVGATSKGTDFSFARWRTGHLRATHELLLYTYFTFCTPSRSLSLSLSTHAEVCNTFSARHTAWPQPWKRMQVRRKFRRKLRRRFTVIPSIRTCKRRYSIVRIIRWIRDKHDSLSFSFSLSPSVCRNDRIVTEWYS